MSETRDFVPSEAYGTGGISNALAVERLERRCNELRSMIGTLERELGELRDRVRELTERVPDWTVRDE